MSRRILAVLVAFALAAVGCLAVVAYVRAADQRAVAGREAVWVLVTTRRVPAGTTAARMRAGGYVERLAMPAVTVPRDALGELDAALDPLALTADVQPRQLLLRGMLGESTRQSGGLALPAGKLAVSVAVTPAARVAGYVRPGATVAIFDTYTMREPDDPVPAGDGLASRHEYNHATRVLLPRVEVIAVGEHGTAGAATSGTAAAAGARTGGSGSGSGSGSGAGSGPAGGATAKAGATVLVTVAVGQDEAERLVHAAQTGTLYLALLDDTATVEPGPGIDNDTLFR